MPKLLGENFTWNPLNCLKWPIFPSIWFLLLKAVHLENKGGPRTLSDEALYCSTIYPNSRDLGSAE